jgi:hypothetical protein
MGLNTTPPSITNEKFEGTKCEIRSNKWKKRRTKRRSTKQYITQKNIEQYEPAKNEKLKSDVPEEQSVPAPLVAPVVLFSLQAQ